MNKLITYLRSVSQKAGLVVVLAFVLVAGTALATNYSEPAGNPTSGNVSGLVDTSGTSQTKAGDFWSNGSVGTTNGFCIGASCISAWPASLPACTVGQQVVYDATGKPQCASTFAITTPNSSDCSGGYCSPTAPVAQALCKAHGKTSFVSMQVGYANNALSSKFCGDYNFNTSTYICDGSCTSSCHDTITSVTCY